MPLRYSRSGSLLNETTSLIKKSLSGTSLASHEDLQNELEVQLQTLNTKRVDRSEPIAYSYNYSKLVLPFSGALLTLFLLVLGSRSVIHQTELPNIDDGAPPLSLLDPVQDLNLPELGHPLYPSFYYGNQDTKDPSPPPPFKAQPTNAWYQNMLQVSQYGEPSDIQRAYPAPYLVDPVGPIPGLQIHPIDVVTNDMVMQLTYNGDFGLTLGAAKRINYIQGHGVNNGNTNRYKVLETTELGITLEWEATKMRSNLVRGMSYVTMEYDKEEDFKRSFLLPTIASKFPLENLVVDGKLTSFRSSQKIAVEKEIEFYFPATQFSWIAFFSEPVSIQISTENGGTLIQVVEDNKVSCSHRSDTFVVRTALVNQNRGPEEPDKQEYTSLLRENADLYPGPNTKVSYNMPEEDGDNNAELIFDWDAKSMAALSSCTSKDSAQPEYESDMLAFALPHQMDRFSPFVLPNHKKYCKTTLTGPACLVRGKKWYIPQELPEIDFRAKRPPKPEYIPVLSDALIEDIKYKMPAIYKRGGGDTYFSGKMLAKLARILFIAEEVDSLCSGNGHPLYRSYCQDSTLPSEEQFEEAVQELREGVEVWINGTAETLFVYDTSWGGYVSCGCYVDHDKCVTQYPNCPAFGDAGLNFGNGYYNDHHFHYGYFIQAAAAVAHFDHEWGKEFFERVLLMVRDIANPSEKDTHFPLFRHKDWYQGSSWASGITSPVPNGKNQESSSEAIAAYEAVALYGKVMKQIWQEENDDGHTATSQQIADVGRLLTATELASAKRYWHVPDVTNDNDLQRIYPEGYHQFTIGILWQTMAQFGTWFGAQPYLPIGIQLLPLTPISEERDDMQWMNSIFQPLSQVCASDPGCYESGWSILQLSTLATVGYPEEAIEQVGKLSDDVFEDAGGNGHSRSNTVWYFATRPTIENPIPMVKVETPSSSSSSHDAWKDCYKPETCTNDVLNRSAEGPTCKDRITWLMRERNMSEWDACWQVAGEEYPDICGECSPGSKHKTTE
jgi:endo-1,3(4)-beta-glucanase